MREASLVPTIEWRHGAVVMIDQRRLPGEEAFVRCRSHGDVAAASKDMVIRGAPAIGVAAALGVALGVRLSREEGPALEQRFAAICSDLAATRPTAVNLFWALERMKRCFRSRASEGGSALRDALLQEALGIQSEDVAACRRLGDLGAELLPEGVRILTHCNAGAVATAGYGTALGIVRWAARQGKLARVFADETRPSLQGARLTAWELLQDGIPTSG